MWSCSEKNLLLRAFPLFPFSFQGIFPLDTFWETTPKDKDAYLTNNAIYYLPCHYSEMLTTIQSLLLSLCNLLSLRRGDFYKWCVLKSLMSRIFATKMECIHEINDIGVNPSPESYLSKVVVSIYEPNAPVL